MNLNTQDLTVGAAILLVLVVTALIVLLVYVVRKLPAGSIQADVTKVESAVTTDATAIVADVKTDVAKVEADIKQTFTAKVLDKLRMVIWLVIGLGAYTASVLVGPSDPIVQTTLYKIGHVTVLAWIGYWIARNAIGRLDTTSTQGDKLGRALVMGAVIIAGSLGL